MCGHMLQFLTSQRKALGMWQQWGGRGACQEPVGGLAALTPQELLPGDPGEGPSVLPLFPLRSAGLDE